MHLTQNGITGKNPKKNIEINILFSDIWKFHHFFVHKKQLTKQYALSPFRERVKQCEVEIRINWTNWTLQKALFKTKKQNKYANSLLSIRWQTIAFPSFSLCVSYLSLVFDFDCNFFFSIQLRVWRLSASFAMHKHQCTKYQKGKCKQ